jgi:uncharacterized protein YebE (UPF0316 family)
MMTAFGTAILIFCLRIVDVSVGTVRVIYTIRGLRVLAATLGFFESLVWIYAISRLVAAVNESPMNMLAWAIGFATGTALGITLEQWIASGSVLMRIISVEKYSQLLTRLREMQFGVTTVRGEGRDGQILILFVMMPRKHAKSAVREIEQLDPDAFVTVEPISHALGGYLPESASPASLKK